MLKTILLLSVAFAWVEATYLRCPPGFYNNNQGQCIRAETEGRTNLYPFNFGVRSRWSDGEGTNKKPEKPTIDAKLMEIIENAIKRFGEETVRAVFENLEASVKEKYKVAFYEATCGKETLEFDDLYECSKEGFDKMKGGKETLDVDTYMNYALELFNETVGEHNLDHDTLNEMFEKEFHKLTGGEETVDFDTYYETSKEKFFDMTGGKTTLDFDTFYEYVLMSGKDSLVKFKSAKTKPQIWKPLTHCPKGTCFNGYFCANCYVMGATPIGIIM